MSRGVGNALAAALWGCAAAAAVGIYLRRSKRRVGSRPSFFGFALSPLFSQEDKAGNGGRQHPDNKVIRAHVLTGDVQEGQTTFVGYTFTASDAKRLMNLLDELGGGWAGGVADAGQAGGPREPASRVLNDVARLLWGDGRGQDKRTTTRRMLPGGGGVHIAFGSNVAPGTQVLIGAQPTLEQMLAAGPELEAVLVPFAGLPSHLRELLVENQARGRFTQVIVLTNAVSHALATGCA